LTTAVEGILLAAGESRRMGYPKPLLKIGSQTFLARTCEAMLTAVTRIVIVVGAYAKRVRHAVPKDPRIIVVENPDYLTGQLSSLQAALSAVSADTSAIMLHLTDHPTVGATTFRAVVGEYERSHKQIIIACYRDRRGHPVLFDRGLFDELRTAPADQGARAVVQANPQRVLYLDVDDPGVVLDLDTPADLAAAGFPPPPRDQ
jgi:molybdenum cofactor cytidylyltransferase